MRHWLHRMQDTGAVVDARHILRMWPIADELKRYGIELPDGEAVKTGVFHERDFLVAIRADMDHARKGIAIWSAFVTPQGVARIADRLRARVLAGVKVRCVVCPPEQNGSIGKEGWAEGVRVLETLGAIIDVRSRMHEKLVLIDDETTWVGSLNPLSHAGKTSEIMCRLEGRGTAMAVVASRAADPSVTPDRADGIAYERENPVCKCGGRTRFTDGRRGRFWSCQQCGWKRDARMGRVRRRGGNDVESHRTGDARAHRGL
jgi:hypothetical protein